MLSLTAVVAAPAWILASTFLTSLTGACVFAALDLTGRGNIAPDWPVGLLCGLGGLADGYLGAMLQPLVPEGRLRQLLGTRAAGTCGDGFVGARDVPPGRSRDPQSARSAPSAPVAR
jgi:uncharacterized membrane protein YfcA